MQTLASAGKSGSPGKRLPQELRVHPQPLVMCVNPGAQNPAQSGAGVGLLPVVISSRSLLFWTTMNYVLFKSRKPRATGKT